MEIRKAMRKRAKIRIGLAAPSGAGKTYSALLIAAGMGEKIGVIDTENGSAELYSDLLPQGYDVITLQAPYTPARYIEAMRAFEKAGYDVIVIDSLSHAWAGEGGSLDKQGKMADRGMNSFAAWRSITPEHNALVESILQSPAHVIATMRAKTEYVLEADSKGKMSPKKVGMAPVMRDGFEYEMTVCLDLDHNHVASASKDRTRLFDGLFFTPTIDTGKKMMAWIEGAAPAAPEPEPEPALLLTAEHATMIRATAPATVVTKVEEYYKVDALEQIEDRHFDSIYRRLLANVKPATAAQAAKGAQA